ncbi:MAG: hypothetical protein PHZ04_05605 [Patescibacteria group bacterium]|nr:hypothetical protein [Patescibacteria group bacterium]MDD5554073.1 hypothetical protein [Patescibacteria group bacterium]
MKCCKIDCKNCRLCWQSLLYSIGVLAYVVVVALVIRNGEKLFGKADTFWSPIAFLMLFIFSALITSSLVLGRPIYLYFDGKKEEAVRLFFCNIIWLFVITLIVFLYQIIW